VRHRSRILLLFGALVVLTLPAGAQALDECRGLQECVSVVGPWVVVPESSGTQLVTVSWELRCPLPGYIVGGTDARVTSRRIEVSIRGEKGSPVSPGVTTRRAMLFTARIATAGGANAFLPAIGCLPSSGGGGRAETAVHRARAVYQPGAALVRRVAVGTVALGRTAVVVARCPRSARLVEATSAVGFATKEPPLPSVLRSVRTTLATTDVAARVTATRSAGVGRGAKSLVQVQALCARSGA
jgi:hypothetical protein